MLRLLFADDRGVVYDHPALLAAVRSGDALLAPPVQAIPERSVELRKRSEEREDDPFDLPPVE